MPTLHHFLVRFNDGLTARHAVRRQLFITIEFYRQGLVMGVVNSNKRTNDQLPKNVSLEKKTRPLHGVKSLAFSTHLYHRTTLKSFISSCPISELLGFSPR